MRKRLSLAVALLSTAAALAGNPIRISSPLFSFLVVEPDGWRLDLQGAAQIAHFVLTPEGSTWRNSKLAIFGRFVPAEPSETIEQFLAGDEGRFREECPVPQIKQLSLDLKGSHDFNVRSYVCPGNQDDVVAVAQVPSHFAVFILSAQSGGRVGDGMEAFKEVLEGFHWLGGRQRSPRP